MNLQSPNVFDLGNSFLKRDLPQMVTKFKQALVNDSGHIWNQDRISQNNTSIRVDVLFSEMDTL